MQVTVTLEHDQWPQVLKALEMAADSLKEGGRTVGEAIVRETRYTIQQQVKENRHPEGCGCLICRHEGRAL